MMYTSSIKREAKSALKDRRSTAVGVFITIVMIALIILYVIAPVAGILKFSEYKKRGLPSSAILPFNTGTLIFYIPLILIGVIYLLANLFVLVPIDVGGKKWHLELVSGKNPDYNDIFDFMSPASLRMKAVGVRFGVGLRKFAWSLLYILPIVLVWTAIIWTINTFLRIILANIVLMLLVYFILVLVQMITVRVLYSCVTRMNKYFLAEYLLSSYESMSSSAAIKSSVQIMSRFDAQLFWFKISFLGWFILAILCFPLFLYVVPYYRTSLAVYAKEVLGQVDGWKINDVKAEKKKKPRKDVVLAPPAIAANQPSTPMPEVRSVIAPPIPQQNAPMPEVRSVIATPIPQQNAPMPEVRSVIAPPTPQQNAPMPEVRSAIAPPIPQQNAPMPGAPPITAQPAQVAAPQPAPIGAPNNNQAYQAAPPIYTNPENTLSTQAPNSSNQNANNPNWGEEFNFYNFNENK